MCVYTYLCTSSGRGSQRSTILSLMSDMQTIAESALLHARARGFAAAVVGIIANARCCRVYCCHGTCSSFSAGASTDGSPAYSFSELHK